MVKTRGILPVTSKQGLKYKPCHRIQKMYLIRERKVERTGKRERNREDNFGTIWSCIKLSHPNLQKKFGDRI